MQPLAPVIKIRMSHIAKKAYLFWHEKAQDSQCHGPVDYPIAYVESKPLSL